MYNPLVRTKYGPDWVAKKLLFYLRFIKMNNCEELKNLMLESKLGLSNAGTLRLQVTGLLAPRLKILISSGSKKKEPRYSCLNEIKA